MLNPASNPTDLLIQSAATLPRDDLLALKQAIDALVIATQPMTLGRSETIDLDEERERRRPEAKAKEKRSADGWIETSYKSSNGKRYGPYRYLRWWQGGVKKSKYLGRVPSNDAI